MRAAGSCSSAQGSASGSVRVERAGERGAAASSAGKGSGAEEGWLRASGLAGQASTPAPRAACLSLNHSSVFRKVGC